MYFLVDYKAIRHHVMGVHDIAVLPPPAIGFTSIRYYTLLSIVVLLLLKIISQFIGGVKRTQV